MFETPQEAVVILSGLQHSVFYSEQKLAFELSRDLRVSTASIVSIGKKEKIRIYLRDFMNKHHDNGILLIKNVIIIVDY